VVRYPILRRPFAIDSVKHAALQQTLMGGGEGLLDVARSAFVEAEMNQ
jgi:hypothetical protein